MADVVDQDNLKQLVEKKIWDKYNSEAHKEGNWAKKFKNTAGEYLKDAYGNDVVVNLNATVLRDLIADVVYDVLRGFIVSGGTLTANAEMNYETGDLTTGKGTAKDQTEAAGILNLAGAGADDNAARKNDPVISDNTLDATFWNYLLNHTHSNVTNGVNTSGGVNSAIPASLTGKISTGSTKVKIG